MLSHAAASTYARTLSWSLIPGSASSRELASTAQGARRRSPRPRCRAVEPAREDDAALGLPRRAPSGRDPPRPRAGRARCATSSPPRRSTASRPRTCRLRARGPGRGRRALLGLADPDGDREHRLGNGEHRLARRAGSPAARMKPARSAPASAAAATSSSRVRPQTLTSGRESSSRSFAPGSGACISAEPTRIASAPASSAAAPCARVWIAALGDDDAVVREIVALSDEVELRAAVDREGGEVARVDADHRRAERDRALELGGVVRLDERVEAELVRRAPSASPSAPSSRSRRSSRTASAPASFAVAQVLARSRRSPSRAAAASRSPARRAGRPSRRRSARRRGPRPRRRRRARSPRRARPGRRPAGGRRPRASAA